MTNEDFVRLLRGRYEENMLGLFHVAPAVFVTPTAGFHKMTHIHLMDNVPLEYPLDIDGSTGRVDGLFACSTTARNLLLAQQYGMLLFYLN